MDGFQFIIVLFGCFIAWDLISRFINYLNVRATGQYPPKTEYKIDVDAEDEE